MTWILLSICMIEVGIIAYLFDKRAGDETVTDRYRSVVLEWTMYLHEKDNGRDFALWRKELGE